MVCLFERALGDDWLALNPRLRERYGVVTDHGRQAVGRGTMSRVDRPIHAAPLLRLFARDDLLVPDCGVDVPFTITTTPLIDANGYEALFLHRSFEFDQPRRFVDTVRWNPDRGCLTDLLGRHGQIATDIFLSESDGALELTLGTQWIRVGDRYYPLPEQLAAAGTLTDWYDDDRGRFEVEAAVKNPIAGDVFGYRGQFENSFRRLDDATDGTIDRSHADTAIPGGGS